MPKNKTLEEVIDNYVKATGVSRNEATKRVAEFLKSNPPFEKAKTITQFMDSTGIRDEETLVHYLIVGHKRQLKNK